MAKRISLEEERIRDDRVKRNVKLADDIGNKVTSLGFNRGYMGGDLSDIYIEREIYQELIEKFLAKDIKDPEAIGGALVGAKIWLQHIISHLRSVRGPLQRLIDYCYKEEKHAQVTKGYIDVIKSPIKIEVELLEDDSLKRKMQLANDIAGKVKALGLRKTTQASIGANLAGIYVDLDSYTKLIDKFLATCTKDRLAIGNILLEVKTNLQHIDEKYKLVKRALERLIEHCYAEDNEEDQESNGS